MREIKFRAWDSYRKHMVSDVLVSTYRDKTTVFWRFPLGASWPWKKDDAGVYNNTGEVLPMQYTGLKDKNGVEIYEGDIVLVGHEPYTAEDDDGNDIDAYESTFKSQVSYDDAGAFVITAAQGYDFFGEFTTTAIGWATADGEYELQVIGNIYENPELLEAGILQKGENDVR